MHISFSGVIAPYTYNCPHAHRLKNIERVVIEPREELQDEEETSRRVRGIEPHKDVARFIEGEITEFPYVTSVIQTIIDNKQYAIIEQQQFFDSSLSPIVDKPSTGDYVSCRTDTTLRLPYETIIIDQKFANPDYGISRHKDETEFFLACEAGVHDAGQWQIWIHFPEFNYTVPNKPYSYAEVSALQQKYIDKIDFILSDKFFKPSPSRARCRFCNYRSYDTGGSGHCDFTVV